MSLKTGGKPVKLVCSEMRGKVTAKKRGGRKPCTVNNKAFGFYFNGIKLLKAEIQNKNSQYFKGRTR